MDARYAEKYVGKMVEVVTSSGQLRYGKVTGFTFNHQLNQWVFHCITERGNIMKLTRREFRVVKSKAGSINEGFTTIFKGV